MQAYSPLNISKKVSGNYFYVSGDTNYFNDFGKALAISANDNASEINLHYHIFDITQDDRVWLEENNISYSSEITPEGDTDFKKGYWVNVRFCRIPEIFSDGSYVMAIDIDSVVVNEISLAEFQKDLSNDFVAIRTKGVGSLGGCVGFTKNGKGRHILKEQILEQSKNNGFVWFMDQQVLDTLVSKEILKEFSMKYVDYHCNEHSKIWTGKGARKYFRENVKAKSKKNKFANAQQRFQKLL